MNDENINKSLDVIEKALQRLESIDNANPSEALKELEQDIKGRVILAEDRQLKLCAVIKQALLKAQEDEKLKVDICEMFGLDNLFPYNDTKAILKELEEYMGERNQLWVDFMKTSKESKEQKKVLEILKSKKYIPLDSINPRFWDNKKDYDKTVDYEFYLWLCEEECEYVVKEEQKLTQEEFDTIKRYFNE